MEDRRELIEKKYGFQVKNQYRARGAILFDTKDGPLLLREKMKLTGHFEWENEVKEHLLLILFHIAYLALLFLALLS